MPTIDGPAFRVGDALRAGMPRRAVDAGTLDRPFTGVRAHPAGDRAQAGRHPLEVARDAHRRAARQFTTHMHPHEFFSHATAALLWDLPMPAVPDRIDVSVIAPRRAPSGRGVHGHQLAGSQVTTTQHPEGVRDRLCRVDMGTARRDREAPVRPHCDRRRGHPHASHTRPARARAESGALDGSRARRRARTGPADRYPRTRGGGSPRPPRCGVASRDVDTAHPRRRRACRSRCSTTTSIDDRGRFVGCVDSAYPDRRSRIEYEGDHHRTDAAQWARDIEKHDALARARVAGDRVLTELLASSARRASRSVESAPRSSPAPLTRPRHLIPEHTAFDLR